MAAVNKRESNNPPEKNTKNRSHRVITGHSVWWKNIADSSGKAAK